MGGSERADEALPDPRAQDVALPRRQRFPGVGAEAPEEDPVGVERLAEEPRCGILDEIDGGAAGHLRRLAHVPGTRRGRPADSPGRDEREGERDDDEQAEVDEPRRAAECARHRPLFKRVSAPVGRRGERGFRSPGP